MDRAVVAYIPPVDLPLWAAIPAETFPAYLRGLAVMQSARTSIGAELANDEVQQPDADQMTDTELRAEEVG